MRDASIFPLELTPAQVRALEALAASEGVEPREALRRIVDEAVLMRLVELAGGDRDGAVWEELDVAAARLRRNPGHLRKVCRRLAAAGLARWVSGGGHRSRWQIRGDVMPRHLVARTAAAIAPERRRAAPADRKHDRDSSGPRGPFNGTSKRA